MQMPRKLLPVIRRPRMPVNALTASIGSPNAVIAAATVGALEIGRARRAGAWQEQAWDYYDAIGELRYAANWMGNALSRATLYIGKESKDGAAPPRSNDKAANEALSALAGGQSGQSDMLKTLGVHLTIAGDCYLIGFNDPDAHDDQQWIVRAPEEVNVYPGSLTVKINGRDVPLPEDDTAIVRIWRQHPRRSWEADSPTRGVLGVLHELERLTQMVLASANSRLAGAGLLLMPSEFDFPSPPNYTPADGESSASAAAKAQAFVNRLAHAMITPVSNRADPSAVVPVVATGPGDQIANVRLITFWTGLDSNSIELRKEAIRRFALGMEMPPEVLLGLGDINHWSAWAIDEAAIKLHIEPLLGLICDALTVGFLRPLIGEDSDLVVWFDTTELVQRPNRGPDAVTLYDRYELSGEALRAEHGFNDSQAPDEEEVNERLLRKMVDAGGASMAQDAAVQLGIFDFAEQPAEQAPTEDVPADQQALPAEPTPQAGTPAQPGPPEQATIISAAAPVNSYAVLAAMAPVLVAHALDYVGKRWLKGQSRGVYPKGLKASRIHERIPVPPDKVDALLAGAFDALEGTAPPHVLAGVTQYVRYLVTTGHQYRPEDLVAALTAGSRARAREGVNGHDVPVTARQRVGVG